MSTDTATLKQALYRASGFYPHSRIEPEQLDLYAEELADLPAPAVVQAIRELCRTSEFFPTLAAIRLRTVDVIGGDALVDPEAAWGEVVREATRVGFRGQPVFSSPFIARAVEAIGWRECCLADYADHPTLRAQFRDALRAIQRRTVEGVTSGRVTAGADPALRGESFRPVGELMTGGEA